MKLEELARQSSEAARAAVVDLDPPTLGADTDARGRLPLVIAAAVVAVIAGAGVVLAMRDDTSETVTAVSGELPVLGLTDPAEFGLTLTGVFDPDELDAQSIAVDVVEFEPLSATFVYFGTPGADDPFEAGDLVVGELVGDEPARLSEGSPVTIRGGLPATIVDPENSGWFTDLTTLEWIEPGDDGRQTAMLLASRSLGVDELVTVANGLDLTNGTTGLTLGEAPLAAVQGLEIVAVDQGLPSAFVFGEAAGPQSIYERADSVSSSMVGSVTVSSSAFTLDDSMVADRWWATSAEAVDIDGTPGWLFTYVLDEPVAISVLDEPVVILDEPVGNGAATIDRIHTVVWQWAPGVVATVSSTTSGDNRLVLDVARSVVELDHELLTDDGPEQEDGLAPTTPADFDEVWGSGSGESVLADGSTAPWSWTVGTQGDMFCTAFPEPTHESSSCTPLTSLTDAAPGPPRVLDQRVTGDLEIVVFLPDPALVVELAAGTPGDLVEVQIPVDAAGNVLVVWVGPADGPSRFDVIRDGQLLTTLDLELNEGVLVENEEESTAAVDVATHPGAQSLGITEGFGPGISGDDGRVYWEVVTHDGGQFIVADGEATFAAALPDDLTVLPPVELADGSLWTYIVARDIPSCVTLRGVSADRSTRPEGTTTVTSGLAVSVISGRPEGRRLEFDRSGEFVEVDLPESGGSVSWPSDLCGG